MNQTSHLLSQMLLGQTAFWIFLQAAQKMTEKRNSFLIGTPKLYRVLSDNISNLLKRCECKVLEERVHILISYVNEVLQNKREKD